MVRWLLVPTALLAVVSCAAGDEAAPVKTTVQPTATTEQPTTTTAKPTTTTEMRPPRRKRSNSTTGQRDFRNDGMVDTKEWEVVLSDPLLLFMGRQHIENFRREPSMVILMAQDVCSYYAMGSTRLDITRSAVDGLEGEVFNNKFALMFASYQAATFMCHHLKHTPDDLPAPTYLPGELPRQVI